MSKSEPTKAQILAAAGKSPKPTQNGRVMPYVQDVKRPTPKK